MQYWAWGMCHGSWKTSCRVISLCHMGPGIELTSPTKPFLQPFHYSAPSSSSQETTPSTDSGQQPCGLPMTGREHTSFASMTVQLLSSLVLPSTPTVYAHSGANILGGPLGHTLYSSSHAGKTPEFPALHLIPLNLSPHSFPQMCLLRVYTVTLYAPIHGVHACRGGWRSVLSVVVSCLFLC